MEPSEWLPVTVGCKNAPELAGLLWFHEVTPKRYASLGVKTEVVFENGFSHRRCRLCQTKSGILENSPLYGILVCAAREERTANASDVEQRPPNRMISCSKFV